MSISTHTPLTHPDYLTKDARDRLTRKSAIMGHLKDEDILLLHRHGKACDEIIAYYEERLENLEQAVKKSQ